DTGVAHRAPPAGVRRARQSEVGQDDRRPVMSSCGDEATAALRHAAVGATRVLGAGPGAPKTGRGVVGTLITSMSFLSLARGLGSDHRGRECAAPGLFCCGGTLPPVIV